MNEWKDWILLTIVVYFYLATGFQYAKFRLDASDVFLTKRLDNTIISVKLAKEMGMLKAKILFPVTVSMSLFFPEGAPGDDPPKPPVLYFRDCDNKMNYLSVIAFIWPFVAIFNILCSFCVGEFGILPVVGHISIVFCCFVKALASIVVAPIRVWQK